MCSIALEALKYRAEKYPLLIYLGKGILTTNGHLNSFLPEKRSRSLVGSIQSSLVFSALIVSKTMRPLFLSLSTCSANVV